MSSKMQIRKITLALTLAMLSLLALHEAVQAQDKKAITLEDIWQKHTFYPKMVSGFINLSDSNLYCRIEQGESGNTTVVKYNYRTGEKAGVLIDGSAVAKANGLDAFRFGTFDLSTDETKALIPTQTESIYRHSTQSVYYVWQSDNKLVKVDDAKIRYATFNPQGTMVAYVKDNNLYVRDLVKGKTKRLTKDGAYNSIINGAVDWVYEEEFSMSRGYEWNADGTMLAYYRFDESAVKEFSMAVYGDLYPDHQTFKYPKAGEANSVVDIYVCVVAKGKSKKLETGSENDQYLPRIKWTKDPNKLSIQRLNRLQNHWELLMADASSGNVQVVLEETNDYYIDIHDDLIFLDDKRHFVMKSEKDGFWHLYMHKVDGPQVFQITKGNWEVEHLTGVDEKNMKVYYTSTETSSIERQLYVIDIDGKNKKRLTTEAGTHNAQFNSNYSLFYHTHSTANSPIRYDVRNRDGELVRMIEDNREFSEKLSEYRISKVEFEVMKKADGTAMNYYMIKPLDFDPEKKYPVLMFVYGGPGSQQVTDQWLWSNYLWHQMLANEHGYIIACVDNRGTGGKGEKFKKMTYKQLGKYETEDQIYAAREFSRLSYVDASRIGIWGWSYGGYMSSLCLFKGNDVFKTAVAVAPVTNWRYYDNIYSERFMQRPQENAKGYDDNSPISHVEKLKGNYLIIHGMADDNVHMQNTIALIDKLIELNKPFDSELYPNKNHGIYGGNTRIHLYTRMTEFILENL